MERKERRSGSPGQRGGEADAVVQRTQVVLLAGESWEPESAHTVLSSFAHHVLPPPALPGSGGSGGSPARRAPLPSTGEPSPAQPPAALPRPPGQGGEQLIFFLCRAPSLRERQSRLREVLEGMREQIRGSPAALVGVIVQPRQEEEEEARRRLEDLLREVFQAEGGDAVEVHAAVFKPGRPAGALEVKRLNLAKPGPGPRLSASSAWLDKSKLMQIFGAMLSVGTVAYGGYYFYNNPAV